MNIIDPAQHVKPVMNIEPKDDGAGTTTGDAVDCVNYGGVMVNVLLGVIDSGHTVSVYVEESDNNSTWSTLKSWTGIGPTGDQTLLKHYFPRKASSKRYLRTRVVRAGTENSSAVATLIQLINAANVPVT